MFYTFFNVMWCNQHTEETCRKKGSDIKEKTPADPHDCVSMSRILIKYQTVWLIIRLVYFRLSCGATPPAL